MPGLKAHMAPGHTPGHLSFVLEGREHDVIFSGDAAKNRAELISRTADMTYDPHVTEKAIEMIWSFWRRRPGSIVVPGHDLPMVQENGRPRYIGKRPVAISAWFGDDMERTTLFNLSVA